MFGDFVPQTLRIFHPGCLGICPSDVWGTLGPAPQVIHRNCDSTQYAIQLHCTSVVHHQGTHMYRELLHVSSRVVWDAFWQGSLIRPLVILLTEHIWCIQLNNTSTQCVKLLCRSDPKNGTKRGPGHPWFNDIYLVGRVNYIIVRKTTWNWVKT